jgi:hypothetical protein
MSSIVFGGTVSMLTVATPSSGWVIGYDTDGILKQKDQFGVIKEIKEVVQGSTGATGNDGSVGPTGATGTGFNTISNWGTDKIITSTGTNSAYAHDNLTFDGTTLYLDGTMSSSHISTINLRLTNNMGLSGSVLSSIDTNGNARWKNPFELIYSSSSRIINSIPVFSFSGFTNSIIYSFTNSAQVNGSLNVTGDFNSNTSNITTLNGYEYPNNDINTFGPRSLVKLEGSVVNWRPIPFISNDGISFNNGLTVGEFGSFPFWNGQLTGGTPSRYLSLSNDSRLKRFVVAGSHEVISIGSTESSSYDSTFKPSLRVNSTSTSGIKTGIVVSSSGTNSWCRSIDIEDSSTSQFHKIGLNILINGQINSTEPSYGSVIEVTGQTAVGLLVSSTDRAISTVLGKSIFNEYLAPNIDFIINGHNSENLFYVNGTSNTIGIGTTSNSYKFQVSGTISSHGLKINGLTAGSYLRANSNGDVYLDDSLKYIFKSPSTGIIINATESGGYEYYQDINSYFNSTYFYAPSRNIETHLDPEGYNYLSGIQFLYNTPNGTTGLRIFDTYLNIQSLYSEFSTDDFNIWGGNDPQPSLQITTQSFNINLNRSDRNFIINGTNSTNLFVSGLSNSVGIGTNNPDNSSILDLSSTKKGFLPPRMTGIEAESINSPAEGLMIYSTDGSGTTITTKGWWGWNGSIWEKLN